MLGMANEALQMNTKNATNTLLDVSAYALHPKKTTRFRWDTFEVQNGRQGETNLPSRYTESHPKLTRGGWLLYICLGVEWSLNVVFTFTDICSQLKWGECNMVPNAKWLTAGEGKARVMEPRIVFTNRTCRIARNKTIIRARPRAQMYSSSRSAVRHVSKTSNAWVMSTCQQRHILRETSPIPASVQVCCRELTIIQGRQPLIME